MRVFRQPATTRTSHWMIAVAFFGLAITGAMLYFHVRPAAFNARNVHLIMAVGILVASAAYYAQAVMNGTIVRLLLRRRDLPALIPMAQYYFGQRPSPPAYDGYNPLQRAAYTTLLLVLLPLLAISGLALWPHAPFARGLATLFGGRSAKTWHVVFAVSMIGFVAGHTFMVIANGFINNVRSMITGW